jgi:hypothetical protein
VLSHAERARNALVDFKMPGAIYDEMETVQGIVRQLDEDVRSSHVRDEFKRAWSLFADEWRRFYEGHRGWWSRTWYAVYEKTIDFRKRVEQWRVALLAEGGHTSLPRDVVDDGLKNYLLIGAGALGVGLIWWITARRRRVVEPQEA